MDTHDISQMLTDQEMLDENQSSTTVQTGFGEDSLEYIFDRNYVRAIFLVLYSVVFFLCVFGNLMVILVVTLHWRCRSITNFCLANLAFADLCVGLFCVYQNIITYLMESWIFGEFMCKMYHFTISLSTTASILILVVISGERYLAIAYPITSRQIMTWTRLRITIILVWILSAAISSPRFYYFGTMKMPLPDDRYEILCLPNRLKYDSKVADMIIMTLLFLIPLAIISILYTQIGMVLWKSSCTIIPANTSQAHHRGSSSCGEICHEAEEGPAAKVISSSDCQINMKHLSNYSKEENIISCQVSNDTFRKDMARSKIFQGEFLRRPFSLQAFPNKNQNNRSRKEEHSKEKRKTFPQFGHANNLIIKSELPPATAAVSTKTENFIGSHARHTVICHLVTIESTQTTSFITLSSCIHQQDSRALVDTASAPGGTGLSSLDETSNAQSGRDSNITDGAASDSVNKDWSRLHNPPTPTPPLRLSSSECRKSSHVPSSKFGSGVLQRRRRIVRMLIVIVLAFAVFHLPFHARKVWQYWSPKWMRYEAGSMFSTLFTPITFLIMYANSALNPFLYAFFSRKFRISIVDLLCCRIRQSLRASKNVKVVRKAQAL